MRALAISCTVLAGCYPGVDNSDCEIRCGEEGACPSNLSCVGGFCVDDDQTCVDPGLVLAYSFDEVEANEVPDVSGTGNTAGTVGDPQLIDGVHGKAMAFDGVDDFLVTRDSPSLAVAPGGAFTVSFWINVTTQDFVVDQIIIGKLVDNDQPSSPFYEFGVEFDTDERLLELFVGTDDDQFIVAYKVTPPLDVFSHVAFTWDGQIVSGYLDGIEQPFPDRALDVTISDRGQNLQIGAQAGGGERFLGALDDVRLYNRALTASEINADLNSSVGR